MKYFLPLSKTISIEGERPKIKPHGAFQIVAMISVCGDTDRGWAVVCVSTNHLGCDNLKCTQTQTGIRKK